MSTAGEEMRYPFAALLPDYARGAVGAALSGGAWALAPTAPAAIVIFGGLTGLFLVFTMRNLWRQRTRVIFNDEALAVGGTSVRAVRWRDLSGLRLRYYSTRRNRQGGWMVLQLSGAGTRVAVDSTLDGFARIIERAVLAARDNDLALDEITLANLAALERAEAAEEARP
jgi:hypothetical protein